VGNSVKGLTKVQVENIHSLSLIHLSSYLVIEGDQVGQANLPFMNPFWLGVIPWLSFACPVTTLRMNQSIIFPDTENRDAAKGKS